MSKPGASSQAVAEAAPAGVEPFPGGLTVEALLASGAGQAVARSDGEIAAAVQAELLRGAGRADFAAEVGAAPLVEWTWVNQGVVTEVDVLRAYGAATGLPVVSEEDLHGVDAFPEVTYDFLSHNGCLPARWDGPVAILAVYHPFGLGRVGFDWQGMFHTRPLFVLARRTVVEHFLTTLYDTAAEDEGMVWGDEASEEALKDLAREAPVVRLVNDMFNRAVEMGASDIHVEPSETELAVRFRVDGMLQTILTPPLGRYSAIASRLKLLASMNIAERRRPQDGRMEYASGKTELDVRVSTVPSVYGESIVLRLLPKDTSLYDLDRLGLAEHSRDSFRNLIQMPYGMLLVVGPTGSGKTTTLYSVMRLLNAETCKIITIEDPVEYQISGLTQIQVHPRIGLSFANGLRSIVRQDPDIILVGEIRDSETAEIAVHAALTGHLVFSTLHTNDAAGAISRLMEMGMEGFLISSALLGVLSQRLVRRVCPDCGGQGLVPDRTDGRRCRTCGGAGYRGRVGIFELLIVNDEIRQAISERRDSTEIARIARRHGMQTLREDGDMKVQAGVTTVAEVARVCQLDVVEA